MKTEQNYFLISALASKKISNQKTLLYNYVKSVKSGEKCLYFFDPTFFLEARAEIKISFGFWFKWEQENLLSKLTDL